MYCVSEPLCACKESVKGMKLQEKDFNFPPQSTITLLSCSSLPCCVVVAERLTTFPLNLLDVGAGGDLISDAHKM